MNQLTSVELQTIIALRLTMLLFLLHPGGDWAIKTPVQILATIGLIHRRALLSPSLWMVLTGILIWGMMGQLYAIDNHKVLYCYWSLAITLWLSTPARDTRVLRMAAKWLLILVFSFAMFWKIANGDFTDGSFAHYTFLFDGRFAKFTQFAVGLPTAETSQGATDIAKVLSGVMPEAVITSPVGLDRLAVGMTWFVFIVEGSVPLMLVGSFFSRTMRRLRHLPIMAFIVLTYPLATVVGFGWILSVFAYAQCDPKERFARGVYLTFPILLFLYRLPWARIL